MKSGAKLREWSRQEMDRLRAFVLSSLPDATLGTTAADGGPLAAGLTARLDDDAWNQAAHLMLGQQEEQTAELATAEAGARR
jgi:hypothetical protein